MTTERKPPRPTLGLSKARPPKDTRDWVRVCWNALTDVLEGYTRAPLPALDPAHLQSVEASFKRIDKFAIESQKHDGDEAFLALAWVDVVDGYEKILKEILDQIDNPAKQRDLLFD